MGYKTEDKENRKEGLGTKGKASHHDCGSEV